MFKVNKGTFMESTLHFVFCFLMEINSLKKEFAPQEQILSLKSRGHFRNIFSFESSNQALTRVISYF